MTNNFTPGSYIFPHRDSVLEVSSFTLHVSKDKLHAHPDFRLIIEQTSIGIDTIRKIGHYLRIKPIASAHKVLVIEHFHRATEEAQNAFLKTFEEPPEYAYIFLVTPYIDRLLKTIISRAQVIHSESLKLKVKSEKLQLKIKNLQEVLQMTIGERLMWLENELKQTEDKIQVKVRLLEIVDAFLNEGVELATERKISLYAVEYLKEAKWKIEQGFPNPKLLVEGFLVKVEKIP